MSVHHVWGLAVFLLGSSALCGALVGAMVRCKNLIIIIKLIYNLLKKSCVF
jgi:hypothetical protein